MKAVVMAGGFGTRLRPLTINIPKPMVPIGNLPMMEHIVGLLAKNGITDITSVLFFQPECIRNHFGNGRAFGVRMSYAIPDDDLGTAGAVRYACGDTDEPILVISGDVITNFDLSEAIKWHNAKKADATILLTRVENPPAFGIVITDDYGHIVRFLEKPTWGEAFSDTINSGIYILEPTAANLIPKSTNFDFSQNLFPLMLSEKMGLYGKILAGYWKDVGNVDEYRRAHRHIFDGSLRFDLKLAASQVQDGVLYRGSNVHLDPDVKLSGTVIIGDDVRIEAGSRLHNCSIGQRCRIGQRCDLKDTIVWVDSQIGSGSKLNNAVVCANARLGNNVQLLDHVIISDDCLVGNSATVKANCKIWPSKIIDEGATVSTSLVWGEKWNRELITDSKVSGLALTEITPEMTVHLGAAFGATLGMGSAVVTSRDASDSTRLLRRSLMSGLLAAGVNVSDLETMPVPVVRYALSKGHYKAGIYVRHNPDDYRMLDIIFFHGSGLDMPNALLKKVDRNYFGEDFERATLDTIGHLDYPQRVLEDYQADFMSEIDVDVIKRAGLKIVIDYSNGTSSQIFPTLFTELGVSATELNANPNPRKFSASSEERAQAVVQLSAIVTSLRADVGFRINSAAEKITVIDEQGTPLDSQTLLLVVTKLFLETNPKTRKIAVPVGASMGVEEIARSYGAEVIRVANEHRAMMDIRRSGEVSFVGGTRGGFIFPGFQTGTDAIMATVRILEMMARARVRIDTIRAQFSHFSRQSATVPCPWSKKGTVMRHLITESANKRRQLIDGVRILEDDGWVLVTPDRLKASFNVEAESTSEDKTGELVNRYRAIVENSQNN